MWSHYSDNHKGICLEFKVIGTFFGAAVKIIYRSEYPKMLGRKPREHDADRESKGLGEGRRIPAGMSVIKRSHRIGKKPLVMRDGFLPIGDALNAVVMGCEMGDEEERIVRELVKDHGQHVVLKRAVRVAHKYSLTLEDAA